MDLGPHHERAAYGWYREGHAHDLGGHGGFDGRYDLQPGFAEKSTWATADRYLRAWMQFVRWLVEVAPSERAPPSLRRRLEMNASYWSASWAVAFGLLVWRNWSAE